MRIFLLILVSLLALVRMECSAQERGFNLVVVGDTQPQTEAQIAELEGVLLPQIRAIVEEYRATGYPTAVILTGDVVWDTMEFLPRIPSTIDLNTGAINPTTNPYFHPQINPHNKTGICIGHNIEPISGICPVKNGNTNVNDKKIADNVRL